VLDSQLQQPLRQAVRLDHCLSQTQAQQLQQQVLQIGSRAAALCTQNRQQRCALDNRQGAGQSIQVAPAALCSVAGRTVAGPIPLHAAVQLPAQRHAAFSNSSSTRFCQVPAVLQQASQQLAWSAGAVDVQAQLQQLQIQTDPSQLGMYPLASAQHAIGLSSAAAGGVCGMAQLPTYALQAEQLRHTGAVLQASALEDPYLDLQLTGGLHHDLSTVSTLQMQPAGGAMQCNAMQCAVPPLDPYMMQLQPATLVPSTGTQHDILCASYDSSFLVQPQKLNQQVLQADQLSAVGAPGGVFVLQQLSNPSSSTEVLGYGAAASVQAQQGYQAVLPCMPQGMPIQGSGLSCWP
jgi:hypothetical protein